ncbi:hypothetical protein [Gordonia sp. DT101]|uniref:hypothetical protein n=1 Tax=Gordonia sp. DT101 TaxID=3416545 RepID=UPI003CE7E330
MSGSEMRATRNPSWIAASIGLVTLVVASACPVILQLRRDDWVRDAIRTQCRDLAALPPAAVFGGLQITFALIAAAAFAMSWRRVRTDGGRSRLVPILAVLVFVGVAVAIYGALIVIDAPTSPYSGVDGSGLPCGSG